MRVSASLSRLVRQLRSHNWSEAQIRSLLSNVPTSQVDQLLRDASITANLALLPGINEELIRITQMLTGDTNDR